VMSTEASVGATRSITEKSFFITGDWPMRVGDFEVLSLGVSCLSIAIAFDLAWLLTWLVDQPSTTVGVARGINQLTPKVKIYFAQRRLGMSLRWDSTLGALLSKLE